MSFQRVAIVNRGEPAMRFVRAAREWNQERGDSLRTIALFSEPDRRALFVREADEAFDLGSATFVDEKDGQRKVRYLDYAGLERALRETRAEAVWVGWGFVSEHADFAELCREMGVVFIGPDPETTRRLGDKIASKKLAEEAGVPVAPWSGGPVASLEEARAHAERLGHPLMVKATAGGGGRGIRRVYGPDQLAEAFESARSEALKGFGDDTVFMERLLDGARHVEVQILGDGQGTTWALGVRDCTIQRRNQKVLEETPSPALSADQHRELCEAAVRLGNAAGYRNAGTVEFLYDPSAGFSFMEVNARLQVEHPVTEEITGVDLVKHQIHVARGGRLEGEPPAPRGHSVEVRVTAEDPERGFAPAPGVIDLLRLPGGAGIRVDTGFAEGDSIAAEFDSMLAKVIAWGHDREEALARLRRALLEMRVAVRGGASNKGFLLSLLGRSEVLRDEVDVGWLDRIAARDEHLPREHGDAALVQAAVEAYEAEFAVEQLQFHATAARGRPRLREEVGRAVELRHRGVGYKLRVHRLGPGRYRIEGEGASVEARVERLGALERRLHVGEHDWLVLTHTDGLDQLVEVNGIPHRLSRDDAGVVRAPSPGVVLAVDVHEGDEVAPGDRVAVLEAMKTELPVLAPFAGRVREVLAAPGSQIDAGGALLALEPLEIEEEAWSGERVDLRVLEHAREDDEEERVRTLLAELRGLVLGFDVDPGALRRLREEYQRLCELLPADDPELTSGEDAILAAFTDICGLFRRRGDPEDVTETERQSPEEYLYVYLRSLDAAGAGLPASFLERLRRALAHYGVRELERRPELDEALIWICKAHQRMTQQVEVVLDILARRLDHPAPTPPDAEGRGLLERIVGATRGRFQAVSDLARQVRYRHSDAPFFEEARERVLAEAERQLATAISAQGEAREEAIEALVDCAEPLVNLLTARFAEADAAARSTMLEVLVRRYYRERPIEGLETDELEGRAVATTRYRHEGQRLHVVAACAAWEDLARAVAALRPKLAAVPEGEDVLIDLFLWRDAHVEADETEQHLQRCYASADFPRPVRRLVAAVGAAGYGDGMASMQHFTHRPDEDGSFTEETPYRGLHPMMGKRLQLWRTQNFEISRLPSMEDLYLFHGVARSNPKDERLFAFVEVRDLTPERDADGRIVRLPRLEMMLHEALAAIRVVQSRRADRARLHWNRVLLYVWPVLELSAEDLRALAHRLAPATEGLGLEKVVLHARMARRPGEEPRVTIIHFENPGGRDIAIRYDEPGAEPIRPLSDYAQRAMRMRRQGLVYPYELIRMLTPPSEASGAEFPAGDFTEYDLDDAGQLVAVARDPGHNTAHLVVGIIRNETAKHPEGMRRVLMASDPSHEMGSFAEPECRRIIAALELAEREGLPVEWYAVSAGAKIAMDSGTENLDWTAAALRKLVEFTQEGGEVNVIVPGINVGGQSYWNAEATMLMHTRGVLIMTPEASMVLTGKRALDYSGGVSAEDHQGIGGYDRIMGRNGQAQYWARDIGDACRILFRYYEHSYRAPGERFPRSAGTADPVDRDISTHPHGNGESAGFDQVGEVFSVEKNRERKRPFEIRSVMRAVIDQDHEPLERWRDMFEAEIAVVWDAHLGGHPVCMIGFESKNHPRLGYVPIDGPEQWSAGTLFPLSSKKVARAINAASGNRPVVVLANLSGFDGSPESMRRLQLEYGAEIGRAVVNFRGPMVFCVISRYHGGAYVVFSRTLNDNLEVAALDGSYASVIGGAPAAAVVFAREVEARVRSDHRLAELDDEIAKAEARERGRLRARRHELLERVRSEKIAERAEEFEQVHSVHRAQQVGSLHHVISASRLRPYLVEAIERGVSRELSAPDTA